MGRFRALVGETGVIGTSGEGSELSGEVLGLEAR